jgi:ATP-dependent helicase HrpA
MCVEAGLHRRGKIGCTQPRRVAAQSVSRRVAEELKVTWGREVGCKMRFNDDTRRDTQVKFMTDGILLAEIQSDPMLRSYSCLILDEAHERSLNIDFLLGYLKGLLLRRPDLKLIVTSATIDTQAFSEAFGGARVIEVSGRLFPVEIRYAGLGGSASEPTGNGGEGESGDELSYLEAAARAVEDALIETDSGDVLVFMPTERDIRDTKDLLQDNLGSNFEIIALFGRMPAAEQQKIFAPGPKRRIIVATNIAETSITIPRIRYVIDAGLARISRYSPRTRTKRLPVESVSQSSANQRAGRAGRLQNGVCVRLYSEEDYQGRAQFTQPEIQRANLAEVILRMKAFRLGDIESFPFLNPPQAQAIRAGYILLHELGALDELNELTPLGRELARLPIDPTFGRMLLQARRERALPEVLVIAAGLSVPDPRERPEEQKEAAAAAHRAFGDLDSDFLSLLNIWRAAPDDAKASRNAFRRFCKANFLSQSRMREWRDIFRQLCEAMGQEGRVEVAKEGGAKYEQIHRAILSGLLGQVAQRKERNSYLAAGNRLVTLFPGSNLYSRKETKQKQAPRRPEANAAKEEKPSQPAWAVCGEIVQTSQLFARMVAGIDPLWAVDLGQHLCKHSYTEPHWSAKAGRVLATERILIHGLELSRRQIDYGRVSPSEATDLFIRGALVEGEAKIPLKFFAENAKLREKIETVLTRVRSRLVLNIDHALYRFYAQRIENVSSVHDLNRFVKERLAKDPNFLCATEADLIEAEQSEYDRSQFPDQVALGNAVLPITYAYNPGEEVDGVTVKVPLPVADRLTSGQLQWIVPGLREEIAAVLLRALPKTLRKPLMPLEPKAKEIAREFDPGQGDFLEAFAGHLRRRYRADVRPQDWPAESVPAHLRPRVEVVAPSNKVVAAGRDLEAIRTRMDRADLRSDAWIQAAKRWEKRGIDQNFEDLPESVVVEEVGGVPLLAYPGFAVRSGTGNASGAAGQLAVDVRLFRAKEEAETSSRAGIRALAELALTRDLAWLGKELRNLGRKPQQRPGSGFHEALNALAGKPKSQVQSEIDPEALQKGAYEHIIRHRFVLEPVFPLARDRFNAMAETVRRELPMLARKLCETTNQALEFREKLLQSGHRYPGMEEDIARLLPSEFLARTAPANLVHLPRYLRAIQVRAERARINPAKDAEKTKQLAAFAGWEKRVPEAAKESFRWMLEEFRVSLFAQELGTAQPVSVQRLQKLMG